MALTLIAQENDFEFLCLTEDGDYELVYPAEDGGYDGHPVYLDPAGWPRPTGRGRRSPQVFA